MCAYVSHPSSVGLTKHEVMEKKKTLKDLFIILAVLFFCVCMVSGVLLRVIVSYLACPYLYICSYNEQDGKKSRVESWILGPCYTSSREPVAEHLSKDLPPGALH